MAMNKSMLLGAGLGALAVTAGGSVATFGMPDFGPKHADVLHVEPVEKVVKVPREACENVVVTRRRAVQDQHQIAGTVIGALAGGLLGNQVGGGDGKKLATVAGAAAGGYAGKKVQENMQANNTYATTETRCKMVNDSRTQVVGYDVEYRLGDQIGRVRMDEAPGERIPVRNGQLVLTSADADARRSER